MIICDIASFYSKSGGGVRTYHNQKLRVFSNEKKHKYIMIAPSNTYFKEDLPGGTIYWIKGLKFDENYYHIIDYRSLRRIIKIERPDVVEFGSPYIDYWVGRLAVRGIVPVKAGYYHCDFPDTYLKPFLNKRFKFFKEIILKLCYNYVKFIYNQLNLTFVASKFISDKLENLGVNNVKMVPLGVDSNSFNPKKRDPCIRNRFKVKDNEKILLYVGRFGPEKGIISLLEEISHILNRNSIHIFFVGIGPYTKKIQSLTERYKNIHLLGYIQDQEELSKIYASSDGFISPGPQETFGLGIIEALASGLPVLSANAGAGTEIITKFNCGTLFETNDKSDMVEKIFKILHSDFKNGIEKAREYLAQYHNWERIVKLEIDFYEEQLKTKGRSITFNP